MSETREIQIRIFDNGEWYTETILAECVGAFAVHETHEGVWFITHVPTGLNLNNSAGVFASPEAAINAAKEIDSLQDWTAYSSGEARRAHDLYQRVSDIGVDWGGVLHFSDIPHADFPADLNAPRGEQP